MDLMGQGPAMRPQLTCVYVTDREFLPCTCFSIVSLVASASVHLDVRILYADDDDSVLQAALAYLSGKGITPLVTRIEQDGLSYLPRPKTLPLATYGRLMMHQVLPADLDRVLYLDGDTLVDIDVAPLATLPLGDALLGAVLDIGRILIGRRDEAQRRLDLGADGDYFNAGVLLIDWQRWRTFEVGTRTLAAITQSPERFVQADQCALNYICRGRWAKLDLVWNYQPACVIYDDRPRAIFHFLGRSKPWDGSRNRHPIRFTRRYQDLLEGSPWANHYPAVTLPYWVKTALRLAALKFSTRTWASLARYKQTAARNAKDAVNA